LTVPELPYSLQHAVRETNATAIVNRLLRIPAAPPPGFSRDDVAAVVATASRHRVFLLLGWFLRDSGTLREWPGVADVFERAEHQALTVDCVRQAELASVLRELDAAGVRAIVVKPTIRRRTCASEQTVTCSWLMKKCTCSRTYSAALATRGLWKRRERSCRTSATTR